MVYRPVSKFKLWEDGNGVDGKTPTWVLDGGKLRYHVKQNAPYAVLCRTSTISTGSMFTSRRGAAAEQIFTTGAYKASAVPRIYTPATMDRAMIERKSR